MKYMFEKLPDSAFSSPTPTPGLHRHVNSRIEIRPHAASRRAVRIE